MPWGYPSPAHSASPAPKEDKKDKDKEENEKKMDEKFKSMEAMLQKHEEARLAAEKQRLAEAQAEAAEKARIRLEEEAEKRRKAEIAEAAKKAKEDAEKKAEDAAKKAKEAHEEAVKKAKDAHEAAVKKATEEHEKKLKELEAATEEATKKQKASEEEAAKLKPPPDSTRAPIKFKDAVGRKFSFPYHLCKTWKGMELLIKQAFLHIDVIGEHVHQGHYDLTGPDGEIILPQVWDTMIQPDWEITMHMWPMEEEKKVEEDKHVVDIGYADMIPGFAELNILDHTVKKPKKPKKPKENSAKRGLGRWMDSTEAGSAEPAVKAVRKVPSFNGGPRKRKP